MDMIQLTEFAQTPGSVPQGLGWAVGSFLAGAVFTAFTTQFFRRYLDRPRLEIAVANLELTCTRNRYHNVIQVTSDLRALIAEWPTSSIKWVDAYYAEYALDEAILSTIEAEKGSEVAGKELDRLLQLISAGNLRKLIYDFACDKQLMNIAQNALIHWPDRAPTIPSQQPESKPIYPLFAVQAIENGMQRTFVHLDLPGNPAPIVGSPLGRESVNQKLEALAYALSFGDGEMFTSILQLAKNYSELSRSSYRAVREELVKTKDATSYLQAEILVTNLGKDSALIAQVGEISVSTIEAGIQLSHVDNGADETQLPIATRLRDNATRLRQTYLIQSELLDRYESASSYIVIPPNGAAVLRFVSLSPLDRTHRDAIKAVKSGNIECTIVLKQSVSRGISSFPWLASYSRSVRRKQRLAVPA